MLSLYHFLWLRGFGQPSSILLLGFLVGDTNDTSEQSVISHWGLGNSYTYHRQVGDQRYQS